VWGGLQRRGRKEQVCRRGKKNESKQKVSWNKKTADSQDWLSCEKRMRDTQS
jgi:hypothetical protein